MKNIKQIYQAVQHHNPSSGITSYITGGGILSPPKYDPLQGAAQGLVVYLANHLAHGKSDNDGWDIEFNGEKVESNSLKQFVGIVVGESGNNMEEAVSIANTLKNNLLAKNETITGDVASKVGGVGRYNSIGDKIYKNFVKTSWDKILDLNYKYYTRVVGALNGLTSNVDITGGAHFFTQTYQIYNKNGEYNTLYNFGKWVQNGTMEVLKTVGAHTFLRYTDLKKTWP